jgi:hypothetical protein
MDMEQSRRVSEAQAEAESESLVRKASQSSAGAALDEEQKRRVKEQEDEDRRVEEERAKAGKAADIMMDREQQERMSEKKPAGVGVQEAGVLEELQDEVDENESAIADVDDAKGLGLDPGGSINISNKASANVADIMAADKGDESLRKYKESLLGAAATKGDLGDTDDPRKVVVTEFRVVFEDKSVADVVYDLSTESGVSDMNKGGFKIKEGSGFKVRIEGGDGANRC